MNPIQAFHAVRHLVSRKIWPGFGIPREALVLDVGSGDKPFWRADVLVDDLSFSDAERAGNTAPLEVGIFVDSPAESLPFDDETFDFVFCSHLLEHSRDPGAVITELLRVTKASGRGYIECPNAIVEALVPFPGHRWHVYEDANGTLLFVRQSRVQHDAAIRNRRHADKVLRRAGWNGYDLFIQRPFTKREGLAFEVLDAGGGAGDYERSALDPEEHASGKAGAYAAIVGALRRFARVEGARPALQAVEAQLAKRGYAARPAPSSGPAPARVFARAHSP